MSSIRVENLRSVGFINKFIEESSDFYDWGQANNTDLVINPGFPIEAFGNDKVGRHAEMTEDRRQGTEAKQKHKPRITRITRMINKY